MAHGTGLYWESQYHANLKTETYAVFFSRLYDYYYPEMSDCYEPTYKATDLYQVEILKWRDDPYRKGSKVADHLSEQIEICHIDATTANMIYWNIKNRNISFEECDKFFKHLESMKKGIYEKRNRV